MLRITWNSVAKWNYVMGNQALHFPKHCSGWNVSTLVIKLTGGCGAVLDDLDGTLRMTSISRLILMGTPLVFG